MNTSSADKAQPLSPHSAKPQDGSLLLEVVEEQLYIAQQENHLLPASSSHSAGEKGKQNR